MGTQGTSLWQLTGKLRLRRDCFYMSSFPETVLVLDCCFHIRHDGATRCGALGTQSAMGEKISPEELSSSCQCWPVSKEVLKAQVRVDFSLGAVDLQVVC